MKTFVFGKKPVQIPDDKRIKGHLFPKDRFYGSCRKWDILITNLNEEMWEQFENGTLEGKYKWVEILKIADELGIEWFNSTLACAVDGTMLNGRVGLYVMNGDELERLREEINRRELQ